MKIGFLILIKKNFLFQKWNYKWKKIYFPKLVFISTIPSKIHSEFNVQINTSCKSRWQPGVILNYGNPMRSFVGGNYPDFPKNIYLSLKENGLINKTKQKKWLLSLTSVFTVIPLLKYELLVVSYISKRMEKWRCVKHFLSH